MPLHYEWVGFFVDEAEYDELIEEEEEVLDEPQPKKESFMLNKKLSEDWYDSLPSIKFNYIDKGGYNFPRHGIEPYLYSHWSCCPLARTSRYTVTQLGEFAACRSWTTDIYQAMCHGTNMNDWKNGTSPNMSWKNFYQAYMLHPDWFADRRAFRLGLAFVNALESAIGTKPSECFKTIVPYRDDIWLGVKLNEWDEPEGDGDGRHITEQAVLVVKADRLFATVPYATSIHQLLFRVAFFYTKAGKHNVFLNRVVDEYTGEYHTDFIKLSELMHKYKAVLEARDQKYVEAVYDKRKVLPKLFQEVFPWTVPYKGYKIKQPTAWTKEPVIPHIHSSAGIGNLCVAKTFHDELNKELEAFYNKNKVEIKPKGKKYYENF